MFGKSIKQAFTGAPARARWHRMLAVSAGALTLGFALAASSALASGGTGGATAYQCTGSQMTLFTNWNGGAVSDGGTEPTFSTNGQAYCLTSISTYHWNNGNGATPGTIALLSEQGTLGPWQATGSPGSPTETYPQGVPNANWTATPGSSSQPVVINGTYVCQDSDPTTWSQDAASGGQGFCKVVVQTAVPVNNTTTTTPTTPSTPTQTTPTPGTPTPSGTPTGCNCACHATAGGQSVTIGTDVGAPAIITAHLADTVMQPKTVTLGPVGQYRCVDLTKRVFWLTNPGQVPEVWTHLTGNTRARTAIANDTTTENGTQIPVAHLRFEIEIVNHNPNPVDGIKVEDKELLECVRSRRAMPTVFGTGTGTPFSYYNGADQGARNISVPGNGGTVTVRIDCLSRVKHIINNAAAVYAKGGTPHREVDSVLVDVKAPGGH